MLTHEDRRTDDRTAEVDTTPALRKLASKSLNWWVAILLVCGPGSLLLGLLVLSPFLAFFAAAGLAGTCARYLIRRDWGALAHISAGLGLVVVGYITARALHHAGVPTLGGWVSSVRDGVDDPNSWATFTALSRTVVAEVAYLAALLGLTIGSTYALVRPYRTRFSRPTVLAGCALLGLAVGFVG